MLKFYLETSIIYFIVFITSGIALHGLFKKAQEKYNAEIPNNIKKDSIAKTTMFYLLISFVPVVRFIAIFEKLSFTFNPDETIRQIKLINETKKAESEVEKSGNKSNGH